MRVYPHKRLVTTQDLAPSDYLNPDLQELFTTGNTSLDAKNIATTGSLRSQNYELRAWQQAQHISCSSLSTIAVADVTSDYDTFGMDSTFTSGACIITGSISLAYLINTVNEKDWILTGTKLIAGYDQPEYKFIIHHKFGVFIDGIRVAETDNLGTGSYSSVHLNFYAPVNAGTHTIEVKVKLPQGDVYVSATAFNPDDYGYIFLYGRLR